MRFTGPDAPSEIIACGIELGVNYFDIGSAYT